VQKTKLIRSTCPTYGHHGHWKFPNGTESRIFHTGSEATFELIRHIATGDALPLDEVAARLVMKTLAAFTASQRHTGIPVEAIIAVAMESAASSASATSHKGDPSLN
jgi:hypothetical protein